ncbi:MULTISPECIES: hypothetical protein [Bradyrhizobium]|uniref:hypothetical protein n=1 Tax=Bradyrhizobium TaxID=374 RepID=UPI001CD6C29B|nr:MULTISPECIES: hypothetical protein [unclassified Bradyrhizobium]MCA1373181.1 hypothetical protein [Bradyrhizobium sp. IC4060]MCA1424638.1 hypothetical protein [Bradyrhizobium sp. NBAIM16]MCA1435453.1 hypothetical protein [Bradyrhizobium sp. BRP20]MCA1484442.1 hypothetical protein [Bradyrhizobium sp. IC4061]MCA1502755.1 hypothetical protein [Bradyrhizobium sp. NBAIM02]
MKRNALLALVVAGLLAAGSSLAAPLITEEEAKLPPPKGAVAVDQRGIMRGPKIEFVSPGAPANSPLRLVLKFQSYGGAKIDPESVKVIFLRTPNVDLTPRVKPFVQPDGINMQDAELPPGEYTMRVDIKDSDGRPGTTVFTLKVAPK